MPLATEASAGIPVGLRRPPAADASEAKGHAAGILFVAPDGDVLLLRRSSSEPNYAGHWALPGGKMEDGETPEEGARREAEEEMGGSMSGRGLKLLDRRMTPTGMAFHTFAHPIETKFAPKINDEHSGYAWAPLDQLPRPLHPGVETTLKERVGAAEDMSPEDWKGLREGFMKFLSEEEAEPEHAGDDKLPHAEVDYGPSTGSDRCDGCAHFSADGPSCEIVADPIVAGGWCKKFSAAAANIAATDSAPALALDRDSVREKDKDGRLKVKVANLSKATVNPYLGEEIPGWEELGLDPKKIYQMLRDPQELERAASTFNGVQLLKKHNPVNAEDHQPYDVVGTTGTEARYEHPFLRNSLHVWSQDAIDDIENEEKRELSCGYHYRPEMTPGNFDGMPYDGVMRDIVGNHVALVKDGRAGPDVVVGDSMEKITMSKPTRFAALTLGLTAAALAPMLAKDAKIELPKSLFGEITTKNFKDKKAALLSGVRQAADGKLRKGMALDASMEQVGKVLDSVGDLFGEKGADESVSEPQHNAMEAAAHGESNLGIPKAVGEEFADADKGKTFDAEPLKNFLKEKGVSDEDIEAAMDMLPKGGALDEETDEDKKKREEAEKAAADAKKALDAQTEEMKDMVKKPAMDEAIKAACTATEKRVRETERGIRAAIAEVKPLVGEMKADMVFDSADDVRKAALDMLGIDTKGVPAAAFSALLKLAPRPGARPVEKSAELGMDEATVKSIHERYPGIEQIGAA